MTTVLTPTAKNASPATPPRVVLALARTEAFRLLHHPAVLLPLAGLFLWWGYGATVDRAANAFPVLHVESRLAQHPPLLFAAAVFIAANLLGLRGHRHGTAQLHGVLPVPRAHRAAAHLLALLPCALLGFLLAAAHLVDLALRPHAAGRIAWLELAVVPAVVLLSGALGLLLAELSRSVVTAPFVLVAMGVGSLYLMVDSANPWRWFALVAHDDDMAPPLPYALVERQPGTHLLWLTALAALAAIGCLLAAGASRRLLLPLLAGCLALTATAGTLQYGARTGARTVPESALAAPDSACRARGPVTYCSLNGFEPWESGWVEVTDRVRERLPASAADRPHTVRQWVLPPSPTPGEPVPLPADALSAGETPVGTRWAADGSGRDPDVDQVHAFATAFAYAAVAPDDPLQTAPQTAVCGSRGVLVQWLAAQAAPGASRSLSDRTFGGPPTAVLLDSTAGLMFEQRDADVAAELAKQPPGSVRAVLDTHWERLTDSATTTDEAARLLGIDPPPPGGEEEEGLCP